MLVDFDVVLVVEVVGFAVDTEVGNVPVLYPQQKVEQLDIEKQLNIVPGEHTTVIVGSATNAGILGSNQPFQMMSELVAQDELVPPQPLTKL